MGSVHHSCPSSAAVQVVELVELALTFAATPRCCHQQRADKLDEKDRATLHSLRQWVAMQLPEKRASITNTTQEEPAEADAVDSSFIEAFKATSFASSRQNSTLVSEPG